MGPPAIPLHWRCFSTCKTEAPEKPQGGKVIGPHQLQFFPLLIPPEHACRCLRTAKVQICIQQLVRKLAHPSGISPLFAAFPLTLLSPILPLPFPSHV